MFARIENGLVAETSKVEHGPWKWVACPSSTEQRATYSGGVFINPPAPVEPTAEEIAVAEAEAIEAAKVYVISALNFMDRFTIQEEADIAAHPDSVVAIFYGRIKDPQRETIDLTSQPIIDGIGSCVTLELLTEVRATEILAGA